MSWRFSLKERRNVSADANEMPVKALFNPRMDSNIHPGDHASPLLGAHFISLSQNELAPRTPAGGLDLAGAAL